MKRITLGLCLSLCFFVAGKAGALPYQETDVVGDAGGVVDTVSCTCDLQWVPKANAKPECKYGSQVASSQAVVFTCDQQLAVIRAEGAGTGNCQQANLVAYCANKCHNLVTSEREVITAFTDPFIELAWSPPFVASGGPELEEIIYVSYNNYVVQPLMQKCNNDVATEIISCKAEEARTYTTAFYPNCFSGSPVDSEVASSPYNIQNRHKYDGYTPDTSVASQESQTQPSSSSYTSSVAVTEHQDVASGVNDTNSFYFSYPNLLGSEQSGGESQEIS